MLYVLSNSDKAIDSQFGKQLAIIRMNPTSFQLIDSSDVYYFTIFCISYFHSWSQKKASL